MTRLVNGRPASLAAQDDALRLSCASGNQLDFAKGRKKYQNQDEEEDMSEEVALSAKLLGSRQQEAFEGINPWNINRGNDPDRIRAILQWLGKHKEVKAIGLQEIKTGEFRAELGLRSIFRDGRVVVDYAIIILHRIRNWRNCCCSGGERLTTENSF
ncbi:hypothetical protein R1sor_014676 [Riccia sorocarpa]|uniref:Endonuclease/exonuclease/phosphatase n=1 Tax=Riccia sorocarpa TaxID=122646 RepID=A0ABD3HA31_9MARC